MDDKPVERLFKEWIDALESPVPEERMKFYRHAFYAGALSTTAEHAKLDMERMTFFAALDRECMAYVSQANHDPELREKNPMHVFRGS